MINYNFSPMQKGNGKTWQYGSTTALKEGTISTIGGS